MCHTDNWDTELLQTALMLSHWYQKDSQMEMNKTDFMSFQHIFIKQCNQQFNVQVPASCLLAWPGAICLESLDNGTHVRVPASIHFRFDIHCKLLRVNTKKPLGLQTHLKHFLSIILYTGAKRLEHLCCVPYSKSCCHINYWIQNKLMDSTEINQNYTILLSVMH